jgi:opacity protein-like surface antigen
MRKQYLALLMPVFFLNLAAGESARADDPALPQASIESRFDAGAWEGTVNEGILFSPFLATHNRPTLDYELTEVQLGYMLTPVRGTCFWRGNVEVVGSVLDGWIVDGRGTYVAGATAWLRYNFVPVAPRLVPFLQAGAGVTSTDLDRRLEGEDFNFNLNLGAGLRYFVTPKWSVNLEYRYQHISNANLSNRNVGVNADGPMVSVSYYF